MYYLSGSLEIFVQQWLGWAIIVAIALLLGLQDGLEQPSKRVSNSSIRRTWFITKYMWVIGLLFAMLGWLVEASAALLVLFWVAPASLGVYIGHRLGTYLRLRSLSRQTHV